MGKTSKVTVLGATSTGKTAIIEQLIFGNHIIGTPTFSTIEDTYVAMIETDRGVKEKVRFYDTAGLDLMKPEVPKHHIAVSDGYVLVYDISMIETFRCIEKVKKEIDRGRDKKSEGFILALGNKSDMDKTREVEYTVAQKWAQKEKVKLFEVSVTNRQSLIEGFVWLASKMNQPKEKSTFGIGKKKAPPTSSVDT
ncbi:NF-kappa-B inhibitor-interacting Ras-like protein 2 isoform X2 [Tubulanus polymorphus]|uniref:NF-kappa-B inhibitor-interacting Ras-like protein 2 isoform X2 n=1 Tax=Tubulanus polymorphus TaxID=672921 RepID=UPI003DA24C14